MMAFLMILYGVAPRWGLLLLPFWMMMLALLALGLGLCSAALAVSYRDVQYIVPVFMQILLYASPIAYAVSAVPRVDARCLSAESLERAAGGLPRFPAAHGVAGVARAGRLGRLLRRRLPGGSLFLQADGETIRRRYLTLS